MAKHSEYMEAFFGVELYKKFEDVLGDLENIEIDLKDISKEVGRLGGKLEDEDRIGTSREMRAAIYESAQQVRDVRTFLDFYFTQSQELSQIILERDAYMLLYQIFKWDMNDVRDLRGWIRDFNHVCKTIGYRPEDLLNMRRLTATPVPEDVANYPVYAVDKHGYCLCGKHCDDIMYIDEIREEMEEIK
ncbi:MAG TPA: hypothetical protein O0Y05_03580 [Methanocorpusculum sp.]|nr:hypothetical protein [Methanocorpusculum sp.]HJJ90099.1 hypothetical protein [Methanocorpusculum sp.]HJJ90714.1 hypothetical protein [Methanocorpusculum sp.]HJK01234.1 hypothetical protein [Methanocorpusculum sp.]